MTSQLASLALLLALGGAAHAQWQGDLLRDPARESLRETLHGSALQLDPGLQQEGDDAFLDGPSAAPRRWWPVLMSALVPGLGEATTGHYLRGGALLGADVAMVSLAISKNSDGDDLTDAFEQFADEHYSEQLWAEHLSGTYGNFVNEFFNVGTSPGSVALYVSKDADRREWYENIGKWEVFFFGWEEYDPAGDGYWPDPVNPVFSTPTQRKYVEMRGEANDAYDQRDQFMSVSLLLRVFSVLQMAYLEGFIGNRYASIQPDGTLSAQLADNLLCVGRTDLRGDSFLALRTGF